MSIHICICLVYLFNVILTLLYCRLCSGWFMPWVYEVGPNHWLRLSVVPNYKEVRISHARCTSNVIFKPFCPSPTEPISSGWFPVFFTEHTVSLQFILVSTQGNYSCIMLVCFQPVFSWTFLFVWEIITVFLYEVSSMFSFQVFWWSGSPSCRMGTKRL